MEEKIENKGIGNINIINDLFLMQQSKMTIKYKEITVFMKKNNIKEYTEDDFVEDIKKMKSISDEEKKSLIVKLNMLLENMDVLNIISNKKYYTERINDILGILFNKNNKR